MFGKICFPNPNDCMYVALHCREKKANSGSHEDDEYVGNKKN